MRRKIRRSDRIGQHRALELPALDEFLRTTGLLSREEQHAWARTRANQLAEHHAAAARAVLSVHTDGIETLRTTSHGSPTREAA